MASGNMVKDGYFSSKRIEVLCTILIQSEVVKNSKCVKDEDQIVS